MTKNDLMIDFKKKKIVYKGRGEYSAKELYSFLMDLFDEPENMRYDIPMIAQSPTEFTVTNGWTIDKKVLKFLKDGTVKNSEQGIADSV